MTTSAALAPGSGSESERGAFIGRLAPPFARLYHSSTDVERVLHDAGLERLRGWLKVNDEAVIVWYRVLGRVSERDEDLEAVIGVARREFPDDPGLLRALEENARTTRDEFAVAVRVTTAPASESTEVEEPVVVRLVDRDEPVGLLASEVAEVNRSRRSRSVLLIGDSGVGKTRLAGVAMNHAREHGMIVLEARCLDQGAEALLPMRDALRSYPVTPTIPELLSESGGTAQESLRFLESFARTGGGLTAGPQLGGATVTGLYEGLADLLLGLAAGRGMCLVVEDLTDADRDTLYFLEFLARKAASSPLLLVSTAKLDLVESTLRDRFDKWEADGSRRCPVPPLTAEDAATLVSLLWTGPPLSEEAVAGVVAVTGGNPFFIEQYVALGADEHSTWSAVPTRVGAVLRRRLARLDEETRDFLAAASVALDANTRLDLLAHVAEVDGDGINRLLDVAFDSHCLAPVPGGMTFVQEVLRRVVYGSLTPRHQQRLHARAGAFLEAEGLFASASHHFAEAGRTDDLVRTALLGAQQAEHEGTFHKAVELYELALPHADPEVVGVALARAYLVTGEYAAGEVLVERLPREAPTVRHLTSDFSFVRGDFVRAREEIELILQMPTADRLETLVRLADIDLYLGDLRQAGVHGMEALALADGANQVARCKGIVGAASIFAGDVATAERMFVEAMTALSSLQVSDRDRVVYTTILGNLGLASEADGHWTTARRFYEDALSKRREVADARGVMQSLHAVARADFALGAQEEALRGLDDVADMAARLSDRLEQGKVEHTRAQFALAQGHTQVAVRHAGAALRTFQQSGVHYDVTHARFTLASAFGTGGSHRRMVEEAAAARVETSAKGYGFLAALFPDLAFSYAPRIQAGLLGYALGDATGLPWVGSAPDEIDLVTVADLPEARNWSRGSTSDDTAVTLVLAEHLVAGGDGDATRLMELLAARPPIRGLGRSTADAIEHFRRARVLASAEGNTSGPLTRSLPVGWPLRWTAGRKGVLGLYRCRAQRIAAPRRAWRRASPPPVRHGRSKAPTAR